MLDKLKVRDKLCERGLLFTLFFQHLVKMCILYECHTRASSHCKGFVTRHLHQSIEEHITSVIGKHLKDVHSSVAFTDLAEIFSILKKCQGKLDCLIQEKPFIRERKLI